MCVLPCPQLHLLLWTVAVAKVVTGTEHVGNKNKCGKCSELTYLRKNSPYINIASGGTNQIRVLGTVYRCKLVLATQIPALVF